MILDKHRLILEEIIELRGNCLDSVRCASCPFAKRCLPAFVKANTKPISKKERSNLAADVLARKELLGEEDDPSEQYNIST